MALLQKRDPRPMYEEVDTVHQAIHERGMYAISKLFTAVANDGFADIHIIPPVGYEAHMRISVSTEAKAYIKTYVGTTYTAAGTAYTPFNRATDTDATPLTAFFTTTPLVLGTLRGDELVGSGFAGTAVGGNSSSNFESIIAPSTDFLIRVQNKGGAAKDISIDINFYLRKTT